MNWIFGVIFLVLAVWAIANIINSSAEMGSKILWIAIVLIFPLLGVIAWYFMGPKSALK
jgi:hypothetical protein